MFGFVGLNRHVNKRNKQLNAVLHEVTDKAFENLIEASPVDVGNFRGNWLGSKVIARVGNPDNFRGKGGEGTMGTIQSQRITNPGVAKGQPPTSFEETNLGSAKTAKIGQDVYITNNLSYAQALENGSSKQAPGGILRVSAQKTRAQMSKVS